MKFFSKKAQTELSLQQIIGLVIAVGIVLATLALFIGLMNIFMKPPGSGSMKTLNLFADVTNAFYFNPKNQNTSCYQYNWFVEDNWAIVGFNANGVCSLSDDDQCCEEYGDDCVEEECGVDDNVYKCASCGPGPCVCLCYVGTSGDVSGDECCKGGSKCKPFPKDNGLERFYRYGSGWCGGEGNIGSESECDMVYEGEDCWSTPSLTTKSRAEFAAQWTKNGKWLKWEMFSKTENPDFSKIPRCNVMLDGLNAKGQQIQKTAVGTKGDQRTIVTELNKNKNAKPVVTKK